MIISGISGRISDCIITLSETMHEYAKRKLTPTNLVKRYLDRVRITYSKMTESSNKNIVDSISLTSIEGFWFLLFQLSKLPMNHTTPSDKKMFNELEPSELETPNPRSPFRIIIMLVIASGVQFPAAKKTSPIIASEMPNVYPNQKKMKSKWKKTFR